MRRTSLKASVTIVICPGVGRISIGYSATAIIRGMPYGTQATALPAMGSPRAAASASILRRASYGAAYCGLSASGVGGGLSAVSATLAPLDGAHTPVRSGGAVWPFAVAANKSSSATYFIAVFIAGVIVDLCQDRCRARGRPAS